MKLFIYAIISFCIFSSSLGKMELNNEEKTQWENYKAEFNKIYTMEEEESRRNLFFENVESIEQFNQEGHSYEQGINQFTDMREDEISTGYGYMDSESSNFSDTFEYEDSKIESTNETDILNAPVEMDWRTKNAVMPVKDQGRCGSCWAFSTAGMLETLKYQKDGKLIGLSEQHLVDCDKKNKACRGGFMHDAFEYIRRNGGISTGECYKYTGKEGRCNYKSSCRGMTVSRIVRIRKGDERQLMQVIGTIGPVSIAMDVSEPFTKYKSGVYNNPRCSSQKLGHAMLAVGYGRDRREGDYWLIKNSWGARWGEQGYVRTARNKNNHCGIASDSSYAT